MKSIKIYFEGGNSWGLNRSHVTYDTGSSVQIGIQARIQRGGGRKYTKKLASEPPAPPPFSNPGSAPKLEGKIFLTTIDMLTNCLRSSQLFTIFFNIIDFLKGLAQAKIIKKSVILFRVLNMTI